MVAFCSSTGWVTGSSPGADRSTTGKDPDVVRQETDTHTIIYLFIAFIPSSSPEGLRMALNSNYVAVLQYKMTG